MNVLVIAPHADDEVLGCGGSIAKHVARGDNVYVAIVSEVAPPIWSVKVVDEIRKECEDAALCLGIKVIRMGFQAVALENVSRVEFTDTFVRLIQKIKPEVVYIPHRGDMQIDHKVTADASMVALRPKYAHVVKKTYAYETISETGWDAPNVTNEFIPNVYNDISDYIGKKIEALSCYKSQIVDFPGTRSLKAVEALATFRGTTVGVAAAEAFVLIREIQ